MAFHPRWVFTCELLVREDKRLRTMNDPSGTSTFRTWTKSEGFFFFLVLVTVLAIESDIDSIVQALKVFGQKNFLSTRQAMRADRYRKWSLDDLAFLEDDAADEEDLGFP